MIRRLALGFGAVAIISMPNQTTAQSLSTASVRLQIPKTERTGPTSPSGGAEVLLAPGQTKFLWGRISGCTSGFGAADKDPPKSLGMSGNPGHTWVLRLNLIEARVDSVVLDTVFEHVALAGDTGVRGHPVRRMLTLPVQTPYTLAYVDGDEADCEWANAMVQLTATTNPSLANASAALGYDLWLVHEDDHGNRQTDEQKGIVAQGDLAHVLFRARQWPVSELSGQPVSGTSCDLQAEISLDFRGRVREDGLIDLSIEPQRIFKLISPDRIARPSMARRGSGRKTLTVKANEAMEFVLPEPIEQFTNVRCGSEPTIDVRMLLQRHKTSLILKIDKEP